MVKIKLLLHNIRSIHNVGSIMRTADGFGVEEIIFSGYTPYPAQDDDRRLPHIRDKIDTALHKTALGAEKIVTNRYIDDLNSEILKLKQSGWQIIALEQAPNSINLPDFKPPKQLCLIIGEEVDGINPELLKQADQIIEIPMVGQKESFNVSIATGVALYHLTQVT